MHLCRIGTYCIVIEAMSLHLIRRVLVHRLYIIPTIEEMNHTRFDVGSLNMRWIEKMVRFLPLLSHHLLALACPNPLSAMQVVALTKQYSSRAHK